MERTLQNFELDFFNIFWKGKVCVFSRQYFVETSTLFSNMTGTSTASRSTSVKSPGMKVAIESDFLKKIFFTGENIYICEIKITRLVRPEQRGLAQRELPEHEVLGDQSSKSREVAGSARFQPFF